MRLLKTIFAFLVSAILISIAVIYLDLRSNLLRQVSTSDLQACTLNASSNMDCVALMDFQLKPIEPAEVVRISGDVARLASTNNQNNMISFTQDLCGLLKNKEAVCSKFVEKSNAVKSVQGNMNQHYAENIRCNLIEERLTCGSQRLTDVVQFHQNQIQWCALKSNGSVWCIPSQLDEKLRLFGHRKFKELEALPRIRQLTQGAAHTCGLSYAGLVFCWGSNKFGQLGTRQQALFDDETLYRADVQNVAFLSSQSLTSCAKSNDDKIYCWGDNKGTFASNKAYVSIPVKPNKDNVYIIKELKNNISGKNLFPLLTEIDGRGLIDLAIHRERICALYVNRLVCYEKGKTREFVMAGPRNAIGKFIADQLAKFMGPSHIPVHAEDIERERAIRYTAPKTCKTKKLIASMLRFHPKQPENRKCVMTVRKRSPLDGAIWGDARCRKKSLCGSQWEISTAGRLNMLKENSCEIFAKCVRGKWQVLGIKF